jgi:hypothetical protein
LTGYSSGVFTISQQTGGEGHGSSRVRVLKQGAVSITTDATNSQAKATITTSGLNGATATLQLGGVGGLGAPNSGFADDNTYVIGTQVNDPSRLSSLRRGDNTQRLNDQTLLASANAAQNALPANPGCKCEFLSWGWWASSIPDPQHEGRTYTALGTYVVGKVPTVPLPQTGSATYNGLMAGVAQNGRDAPHLASGSYQNVWNFQSRTGVFNGSFDSRNYAGTTQATGGAGSTTFAGSFSGGNRSGKLSGGFFASPSDPAAYQAGTFSVGGHSHYRATGIFAGQR